MAGIYCHIVSIRLAYIVILYPIHGWHILWYFFYTAGICEMHLLKLLVHMGRPKKWGIATHYGAACGKPQNVCTEETFVSRSFPIMPPNRRFASIYLVSHATCDFWNGNTWCSEVFLLQMICHSRQVKVTSFWQRPILSHWKMCRGQDLVKELGEEDKSIVDHPGKSGCRKDH